MIKQQNEFVKAILNQILSFQRDGWTDFNIKTGKEQNPDNLNQFEECIVVDMTNDSGTKTVNFYAPKES